MGLVFRYLGICAVMGGLSVSCVMGKKIQDGAVYATNQTEVGKELKIEVVRGEQWMHVQDFGAMKFRVTPQVAVWIEDTNGAFIQNIFVTQCFAKQKWYGIKSHPDSCYRTMCMPYWFNKMLSAGIAAPTQKAPLPDAVSGATPGGSFTINTKIPKDLQKFNLCFELNKSFDNNETWKKGKAAETFNGQPAIVYSALINLNDANKKNYELAYTGRSGETGNDPKLLNTKDGLTTALEMVKSVRVSW